MGEDTQTVKRGERVIDLFAGPGGWDVAARELGVSPVGVEWDDAACATRRAAGHRTVQADVAQLDPVSFAGLQFGGGWTSRGVDGLIASPPCQAWSMAGKRGGEQDKELVYEALRGFARGEDYRAGLADTCEDPRSLLVCEPLRWALALEPTWIALEQVPPVIELWEHIATTLQHAGWHTWTGVLSAERYGVPQTRKRAILLAHRDRPVSPPPATHQAYVPGEPAREEHTLEGVLLPWVSMATALGWEGVDRPAPTVTGGGGAAGGPEPFARGGREAIQRERVRTSPEGTGRQGSPTFDPHARPSRTVTGLDLSKGWTRERPAPTIVTSRRSKDGMLVGRQLPEGEGENVGGWGWERPSTAVCADPRISPPGWRGNPEDYKNPDGPTRSGDNAVRVTVQEAAVLQGFPPDYPWAGSRTKQFEQVGNAVPPPLAKAVLSQVIGRTSSCACPWTWPECRCAEVA